MWGGGGSGGVGSDSRSSRVFALSDTRALYEALGVDRHATADEIKRAFRTLAVRYHPDKNPSGAERFQEASYAYRILSDPEQRSLYDASRLRATVDARPSRAMDPSVELSGDELRGFVDSLAREEREAESRRLSFEAKRRREAERRAAFDRENPAFHMPSFAAAAAAAAAATSAAAPKESAASAAVLGYEASPPPTHHGLSGVGETPYGRRRSAHSPANSAGGSSSSSDGRCGGGGGGMPSSSLPAAPTAPTATAGGGGGRSYPYASAPESYFVSHKPYYNSDVSELRQRTRGFDYRVYIQERKGAHLVSDAILSDALKGAQAARHEEAAAKAKEATRVMQGLLEEVTETQRSRLRELTQKVEAAKAEAAAAQEACARAEDAREQALQAKAAAEEQKEAAEARAARQKAEDAVSFALDVFAVKDDAAAAAAEYQEALDATEAEAEQLYSEVDESRAREAEAIDSYAGVFGPKIEAKRKVIVELEAAAAKAAEERDAAAAALDAAAVARAAAETAAREAARARAKAEDALAEQEAAQHREAAARADGQDGGGDGGGDGDAEDAAQQRLQAELERDGKLRKAHAAALGRDVRRARLRADTARLALMRQAKVVRAAEQEGGTVTAAKTLGHMREAVELVALEAYLKRTREALAEVDTKLDGTEKPKAKRPRKK